MRSLILSLWLQSLVLWSSLGSSGSGQPWSVSPPVTSLPATSLPITSLQDALASVTQGQVTKISPSDGQRGDRFSVIINVDNGTILSGSREDDIGRTGWDAGSAYIFDKIDGIWQETAKLIPQDGQAKDLFGDALALDGDIAVISAWKDDDQGTSSGSAYLFERIDNRWYETAKLLPQDGRAYDLFGISPAVDGETVMVGSFQADIAGRERAGAVYVFEKVNGAWTEVTKLVASDPNTGDGFGRFIDIDGDLAVIGAIEDDERGWDAGAAYIFERQAGVWQEVAKLVAPDGGVQDYFGRQVRIQGRTVMVGAMNHQRRGAAYFFEQTGPTSSQWQATAKLMARQGNRGDQFGRSITFFGDVAFVGAPQDPDRGPGAGAVYLFVRQAGVWQQAGKFQAPETTQGDQFGRHVFYDGCDLVVAADYRDEPGQGIDVGAAYVYELTPAATEHLQPGLTCSP